MKLRETLGTFAMIVVLAFFVELHISQLQGLRAEAEVKITLLEKKIRERNKEVEDLEKKKLELEKEISEWREAAKPIAGIFRNELAYIGLSEEDLLYNLKPINLWLAIRPCKYIPSDEVCKKYADYSDEIPVVVVVLDP